MQEAEDAWTETGEEIANRALFPKADSWIFGANNPGKTKTVVFYLARLGGYERGLRSRGPGLRGLRNAGSTGRAAGRELTRLLSKPVAGRPGAKRT